MNCAKIENLSDGREPVSITDLLARAEAADILGDNYDLDRLRDLVQADRTGGAWCFLQNPVRKCGLWSETKLENRIACLDLYLWRKLEGLQSCIRFSENAETSTKF